MAKKVVIKRKKAVTESQVPLRAVNTSPVPLTDVVASVRRVQEMSKADRLLLCDEIYKRQPALLAHVLVLHRLGVCMQKIDRMVNILIVLYDLFSRASPTVLPPVSEDILERVNTNQLAFLKLLEGEDRNELKRLCELSVSSHPEINALAFILGDLREAGIADMHQKEDEYCVRTARNILDAIIWTRDGRTHG